MQSATLKHSRDDSLPSIGHDSYLQVYTHKSLRRPGAKLAEYDDNERLSVLGAKALEMAVLDALMGERPFLSADQLETRVQDVLAPENIDVWVSKYNMCPKIRCHPDYFSRLSSPEETCMLFHAYVGAVFAEQGIETVKHWVESLLGIESSRKIKSLPARFERSIPPHMLLPTPAQPFNVPKMVPMSPPPPVPSFQHKPFMMQPSPPPPPPMHSPPPQPMAPPPPTPPGMFLQQQRHNFHAPPTPIFQSSFQPSPVPTHNVYQHLPPPPPPVIKSDPSNSQGSSRHTLPPPPYQAKISAPNPMAPAQPGLAFLPLFNQTAAQRRVNVEYQANFAGPSHAGKWTVTCVVNGIPKGTGSGGNKQIAKEEAARAAYYSMGWT